MEVNIYILLFCGAFASNFHLTRELYKSNQQKTAHFLGSYLDIIFDFLSLRVSNG